MYFVQTLFFIILFVMLVCGSHCKNESLYCTLNCPNTHTKNFWKLDEDFRAGGIVLSVFFSILLVVGLPWNIMVSLAGQTTLRKKKQKTFCEKKAVWPARLHNGSDNYYQGKTLCATNNRSAAELGTIAGIYWSY